MPDQLRSAVKKPHRYDPELNRTYYAMAEHYEAAVVPARPRRPKDKAKAEAGVLLAQRWILACLRNQVFFCLDDLNEAVALLLERLNTRPFQKLEGCRRSAFEQLDRPAMQPLPARRYEIAEWKKVKAGIDYHVQFDWRYYSVPCALQGAELEVRATSSTVEILHQGQRVASHRRSYGRKGTAVTCEEHRPKSHRDYGQWTPARMVQWAGKIGPSTAEVVERILDSHRHPEMGYRSCLGLIRQGKTVGQERLEAACKRAIEIDSPSRRSVEMILKKGLDKLPQDEEHSPPLPAHDNIRGPGYYETDENIDVYAICVSRNGCVLCCASTEDYLSNGAMVQSRNALPNSRQSLIAVQPASGSRCCESCVPASDSNIVGCMSRGLATNQLQLELEARA